jgi:hypothetical protein
MVALVENKNVSTVKTKMAVNIDEAAVEEVVDVGDDEGTSKAKTDVGGMAEEGVLNGGSEGVVDVAVGKIVGCGNKTGVGADGDRGDSKKVGLEEVDRADSSEVTGAGLERKDRRKRGRGFDEVSVQGIIYKGQEVSFSCGAPVVSFFVSDDVVLMRVA